MDTTIWLEKFCGKHSVHEAFWSNNLTIDTAKPEITDCFQQTILVWVPSAILVLGSCGYLPYVRRHEPETPGRGISTLSVVQLIATVLLIVLQTIDFINVIVKKEGHHTHPVDYTAAVIIILTYVLEFIFHFISAKRGFYNLGVSFLFWLFTLLCSSVVLWSKVAQDKQKEVFDFTVFTLSYCLIVVHVICTFIPDNGRKTQAPTPVHQENTPFLAKSSSSKTVPRVEQPLTNPSLTCSFPSYIVFAWFMPIVVKGYKTEITVSDIWKLRQKYSSQVEIKRFDRQWKKKVGNKLLRPEQDWRIENGVPHNVGQTNGKPNLQKRNSKATPENNAQGEAWTLIVVLLRTFGLSFFPALVLIFAYFTCLLINPFLLQEVIQFIEAEVKYTWQGYFYAISMFMLGVLGPIFFHNHLIITFTVGMRFRTVLTTAIYRKALKLSAIAKRSTTVGEIVNLMSIDVQKVQDTLGFLLYIFPIPALIAFAMYFLWQQLGPSCLAGLIYMFGILPIASQYITRKIVILQVEQMKFKDDRIKIMNQVIAGIKVLKLYAWEPFFEDRLREIRRKETDNLRIFWILIAIANALLICTPFIVAFLCFTTYVLSNPDNVLTAEVAFVSLSYLNILSLPINVVPFVIMQCAQGYVSLRRISKFLQDDEINPNDICRKSIFGKAGSDIVVKDGTFSWGEVDSSILTDINLDIERGSLVAVVGEVGSGKSSMLAAILGDMLKTRGQVIVIGSQAYVPQHAWIQNLSLKDNILFGEPLNKKKYKDVLSQCALEHDLEILPGGDMTEIGERGINLSGGQKQRVSLARAVYHDADIFLLDDPLSAVDSHVGKHIFDNVLGPQGCLKHKTRILVTNQLQYLQYCDEVIVMGNGKITEQGTFDQLIQHDGAFAQFIRTHLREQSSESDEEVKKERQLLERALSNISAHSGDTPTTEGTDPLRKSNLMRRQRSRKTTHRSESVVDDMKEIKKTNEALLVEEDMAKGTISLAVMKWYVAAGSVVQICVAFAGLLFFVASQSMTNIWLSIWSNDASLAAQNETVPSIYMRLGVYGGLGVCQVIGTAIFTITLALATVGASKILHNKMLSNVLKCPMSFFDTTPLGRILNRFSKDIDHVDKNVPEYLQDFLLFGAPLISTFVVILYSVPIFTVAFIPMVILFFMIQRVYANCARQLKRLDSVRRSPIYNFFSETLSGVSSIRAYNCEKRFIDNNDRLLDLSQSIYLTNFTSNRWVNLIGEFISAFVVLFVSVFSIAQEDTISAGLAGLAITYSLQLSIDLTMVLRTSSELETYAVAIERVKEYSEAQTEAPWKIEGRNPGRDWPQFGFVEFQNYSTRYRPGLDLVLRDFNLRISASEKVGVVGRTGAGKSSLALALFRLLEPSSGKIIIDDLDISTYGLHDVRSRLTIIPQDPVLFSGSLRFNMDPAEEHDEKEIWDALQQSHLKPFVLNLPSQLEYECGEDGTNLSVGQRQLVCLARALLRKTRVLVLDEATASVDMETDSLIQATIKEQFQHCTIITVAHRLNTILDYDRILVMDAGQVAEFDTPSNLLDDKSSKFYSMAKDAGITQMR